jgi:hypothetical protein
MNLAVAIQRPILVHVVDASSNLDGFEHACTHAMTDTLRAAGVRVTASSPQLAMSLPELNHSFAVEDEWNLLLFVSHGEREPDGKADYLRVADQEGHWYLLHGLELHVQDKAICLCVCEGDTEDAWWTVIREQLAIWCIAPTGKITDTQAGAFFPAVIEEMHHMGVAITPGYAKRAVDEHNAKAGGMMVVRSGVGMQ